MPDSQTKAHGASIALSSKIPVRDDFVFWGWTTVRGGTTPEYQAGERYSQNEDLVLYAVWSERG